MFRVPRYHPICGGWCTIPGILVLVLPFPKSCIGYSNQPTNQYEAPVFQFTDHYFFNWGSMAHLCCWWTEHLGSSLVYGSTTFQCLYVANMRYLAYWTYQISLIKSMIHKKNTAGEIRSCHPLGCIQLFLGNLSLHHGRRCGERHAYSFSKCLKGEQPQS